ncbi:Calx-beta domain-containing protein [SAR116 cluster alpha proteobacterium HIMB100]|nr:Calx-beta domain-containing protein [SAR116 cluster alpha proteobacterium HIMB100]
MNLSGPSATAVTANYTVTGTASGGGTDYTLADGTITIAANTTSDNITIASIVDDSLYEGDETVILNLSSPSGATLGATTAHSYTITENEAVPTIQFNSASSNGLESVSSKTVAVTLSGPTTSAVTANYTVTGTATGGGADYTLADGTITIAANSISDNITIASIIDDNLYEGDETVILTLSSPSGATLGATTAHSYTITENEAVPTIQFNAATSSGAESVSSASIQVDLSGASSTDITATFTVTGTATGGGSDHNLANGSVLIAATNLSANINISSIIDDSLYEGDETIIVTLSAPSGATLGSTDAHSYTITDNEVQPTIQFNAASSSGAESVSSAVLQVDLSGASASAVTANYTVTGTATGGGTDYTLADGTITIAANSISDNITIASIIDDNLYEGDETVIVTLSSPTGATLGATTAHSYTITDNDAQPTIQFNAASSSGVESVSSAVIQVSLSRASSTDITATYTVSGTASGGGTDHNLASGTVLVSATTTSANITIPGITDDNLYEGDETVILTLSSPSGASLGATTAHTYTITDNEAVPTIEFNNASSNGAEAVSSKDITVSLSGPSTSAVTANYTVTGTATGGGTDYILADGTITIAANTTSDNITIASIADDNLYEGDETVIVTLSAPSGATLGSTTAHTYTITDNEGMPTIQFNSAASNGSETISSKVIAVTLSGPTTSAVTASYTVTGTATGGGTDYTLADGTVTIAANTTSDNITIASIIDDNLYEGDETVIITLSAPSGATLGPTTAHTYTITENDTLPTLQFSLAASSGAESVSSKDVAVVLSGPTTSTVTASYAVTGSATGGGTDYTLADGTITIAANSTSDNITISSIIDDSFYEGDETVILTLSAPTGATLGSVSTHTYTINDNEGTPTLSVTDRAGASQQVSSSYPMAVSLSVPSSSIVTVDYAAAGGTATEGKDYNLQAGTLTFQAGETAKNIIVTILPDSTVEGSETLLVSLTNPTGGAVIGNNTGIFTISPDPNIPVVEKAIEETQTIVAEHVNMQGRDLMLASQNLIKTTIDNLVVQTVQASRSGQQNRDVQTAGRPQSPSTSFSFQEEPGWGQKIIDGINLLEVDANDFGARGALDFNHYEPLANRRDAIITKITAAFSQQDNGPESASIMASLAKETKSADGQSVSARFIHLAQTNADFSHRQTGTQDSKSVSVGMYSVYSPGVDFLFTSYLSVGVSQTEMDIEFDTAKVKDVFNSYNAQAGISLSGAYRGPSLTFTIKGAIDGLVSRQEERHANVLVGSSYYRALIEGRTVSDYSGTLTPMFIFDLGGPRAQTFEFSPSIKCGNGTADKSCGYGVKTSLSQMFSRSDGHYSVGLAYDRYRKTDTISYSLDINQPVFGGRGARFDANLNHKVDPSQSRWRGDFGIETEFKLPLQFVN